MVRHRRFRRVQGIRPARRQQSVVDDRSSAQANSLDEYRGLSGQARASTRL